MKKLSWVCALAWATAASALGQGEVVFTTSVNVATPPIDAPVFMPGSTVEGPGPDFTAALYLVPTAGPDAATLIENSITPFRSGSEVAQRYIVSKFVSIPGHPAGSTVTLLFRAWQTSAGSFESARSTALWGQSAPFDVTLATQTAYADPTGIQGFTLIPEPATLSIALLAAVTLLRPRPCPPRTLKPSRSSPVES